MKLLTFDVPGDSALGELAPHIAKHFGEVAISVETLRDGDRIRIDVPAEVGMIEEASRLEFAFGERDTAVLSSFVFDTTNGSLLPDSCHFNRFVLDRRDEIGFYDRG